MKHYTSTSKALQTYYKARHIKRDTVAVRKEPDTQNTAIQARDYLQGFVRRHNGKSKKEFITWLLK